MSIENEIKKLIESIDRLTDAIIESKKTVITENKIDPVEEQSKTVKKVELKTSTDPLEYEADNKKNEAKVKITSDMVKQLAKEKMAEGVDRPKIKEVITSLAGQDASIADLDESNIEECYNKISELQPESK